MKAATKKLASSSTDSVDKLMLAKCTFTLEFKAEVVHHRNAGTSARLSCWTCSHATSQACRRIRACKRTWSWTHEAKRHADKRQKTIYRIASVTTHSPQPSILARLITACVNHSTKCWQDHRRPNGKRCLLDNLLIVLYSTPQRRTLCRDGGNLLSALRGFAGAQWD